MKQRSGGDIGDNTNRHSSSIPHGTHPLLMQQQALGAQLGGLPPSSSSPGPHLPALSPAQHLLSHPTLGLRCTPSSSSKVRVARQGTELSSGLRACASQAGDRSSSKEQEESKGEKLKEKKIKLCQTERPKQWYREARQERRFERHSAVTEVHSFRS